MRPSLSNALSIGSYDMADRLARMGDRNRNIDLRNSLQLREEQQRKVQAEAQAQQRRDQADAQAKQRAADQAREDDYRKQKRADDKEKFDFDRKHKGQVLTNKLGEGEANRKSREKIAGMRKSKSGGGSSKSGGDSKNGDFGANPYAIYKASLSDLEKLPAPQVDDKGKVYDPYSAQRSILKRDQINARRSLAKKYKSLKAIDTAENIVRMMNAKKSGKSLGGSGHIEAFKDLKAQLGEKLARELLDEISGEM